MSAIIFGVGSEAADPGWTTHRMPWAAATSRAARTLLRSTLSEAGADQVAVGDAELVLAEMIANAVLHGVAAPDGTIEVSWRLVGRSVELRVTDDGDATLCDAAMPGASALGGRGLALVAQLSDRWSQTSASGTSVTATVRLFRRPATGS